jgi:hypothetical protein
MEPKFKKKETPIPIKEQREIMQDEVDRINED